ncbi:MAG: Asp-tRNA(Asn)/Glu-tRNA(Gln) amidotransferase subunit GatB [Bacteroidota bacterium]
MSESIYNKYETVIGLEVHAQMLTKSKAYCADEYEYGAMPNTQVSPISLGHPGTLPKHNLEVVKCAVKMGLALGCTIAGYQYYARKNYFYADLPKGYQITQDKTPICTGGFVEIKLKDQEPKQIGITRIHMEEDSGKSIHDQDVYNTLIDLNRAGVPLIEIVTEPDIKTGEEAYQYLTEIRKLVRYLDICDGNMEEGSLRCDANISVMLKGSKVFGTKVEVKNMNSFKNVERAIDFEIKRQIDAIEAGATIVQETRTFDAQKGITITLRTKEGAADYRYFPEPDLPPLRVTQTFIDEVKQQMPALPKALFDKYTKELGLTEYDANVLTENKEIAHYFEQILLNTTNTKAAANWVMGAIKSYLNEQAVTISEFVLKPTQIAEIIALIDGGKISSSAAQKVFSGLVQKVNETAENIAIELNLIQESNSDELQKWIDEAIAANPAKVAEYKAGKQSLVGMFMGDVMKLSKGKADPKIASKLVKESLDKA